MMHATRAAAHEALACYVIDTGNEGFRYQHIVDGAAAETADAETRPITVVFALIGLYLFVEKNWSGAAIQKAHTRLAAWRKVWPAIALPADRGAMGMVDVMNAPAGAERDRMIALWCESLWRAYGDSHEKIRALAHEGLGMDRT